MRAVAARRRSTCKARAAPGLHWQSFFSGLFLVQNPTFQLLGSYEVKPWGFWEVIRGFAKYVEEYISE